jgi:hypothetical protein
MGDACEMLVAAELTLAGIPALKAPDNWPGYDVIAQPSDRELQRISVKSRTFKRGAAFVDYWKKDQFDWLAIVILPGDRLLQRQIYLLPRTIADQIARRDSPQAATADQRYWRIDEVERLLGRYLNNFALEPTGTTAAADFQLATF